MQYKTNYGNEMILLIIFSSAVAVSLRQCYMNNQFLLVACYQEEQTVDDSLCYERCPFYAESVQNNNQAFMIMGDLFATQDLITKRIISQEAMPLKSSTDLFNFRNSILGIETVIPIPKSFGT